MTGTNVVSFNARMSLSYEKFPLFHIEWMKMLSCNFTDHWLDK